jgi:hypothetical protein
MVGVFIGVLLSVMMFSNRSCSGWLPNQRVLDRLSDQPCHISEHAACQMRCMNIRETQIDSIRQFGNVRFSKSEVHEEPFLYIVEYDEDSGPAFEAHFQMLDTASVVLEFALLDQSASCHCE